MLAGPDALGCMNMGLNYFRMGTPCMVITRSHPPTLEVVPVVVSLNHTLQLCPSVERHIFLLISLCANLHLACCIFAFTGSPLEAKVAIGQPLWRQLGSGRIS